MNWLITSIFFTFWVSLIFALRLEAWLKSRGKSQKTSTYLAAFLFLAIYLTFGWAVGIFKDDAPILKTTAFYLMLISTSLPLLATLRLWLIKQIDDEDDDI